MRSATARWNDDWDHFAASLAAHRALHRWRHRPALAHADLHALLAASGAGATVPDDEADRVLGELVALAAADVVAGRVVLQRVMPGLVTLTRRRTRSRSGVEAALPDVIATAWTVIATYPLERRPGKYASNIVRDTEYQCFVRPRRLRRVAEHPVGLAGGGGPTGVARLDGEREGGHRNASELVAALIELGERHGLSVDDSTLLRHLYLDGRDVEAVAAERSISGRAVRYRRRAAVARLARLAA